MRVSPFTLVHEVAVGASGEEGCLWPLGKLSARCRSSSCFSLLASVDQGMDAVSDSEEGPSPGCMMEKGHSEARHWEGHAVPSFPGGVVRNAVSVHVQSSDAGRVSTAFHTGGCCLFSMSS